MILFKVREDAFASLRAARWSMHFGGFNVLPHEGLDASGALRGLKERAPQSGCADFRQVLMLRNSMDFFFVESAEIENLLHR